MKTIICLIFIFLFSCSSVNREIDLWDVKLNLPEDTKLSEIGGGDSEHGHFILKNKKIYFDIGGMGGFHLYDDDKDIKDYENYKYFVSNDQKLVFFSVTRREDKMFFIGGRNHSFEFMIKAPSIELQKALIEIAKKTIKKVEPKDGE